MPPASYSDDDTSPWPVVAHSVTRRSASALSACSSGGSDESSAGSAGSGPFGARSASGPIETPTSFIDTPMPGAGNISPTCKWSFRCLPTSGASSVHATPTASSSARGPMPESISTCGDPTAPPLRITSRSARTTLGRAVGRAVFDARRSQRAAVTLEHDARDVRVADDLEVRALLCVTFEERVIRARALAVACGRLEQRHDAVGPTAITAVVVAAGDAGRDRGVDELLRGT